MNGTRDERPGTRDAGRGKRKTSCAAISLSQSVSGLLRYLPLNLPFACRVPRTAYRVF